MNKQLRRRHFQIWSMLLVLLPVSIIMARLAIPKFPANKLLQPQSVLPYPEIIKTVNKEDYTINIRKANNAALQLEWINKKILNFPTATIYKVPAGNNDIKKGILIGRIESKGDYRFAIDTAFHADHFSSYQLVLYDFIHQQVIDTIKF